MSWFHCVQPCRSAAVRLFCFPHAGGSAGFYRSWADEVGADIELHAVQYPGRADRLADPLIADVHQLAALVTDAMSPLLDQPVALFGHSMGATVAYEVALRLAELGNPPRHLVTSGARAPHEHIDDERLTRLSDDELVSALVQMGDTSGEMLADPELRELVLPYVRNDFQLIENYSPRSGCRLAVPITALVGDSDPSLDAGRVVRWGEVTDADFTSRVLPGGHFYLVDQQAEVISELSRLVAPRVVAS